MTDKVILVDCDGVLVDWLESFNTYLFKRYNIVPVNTDTYSMAKRYNVVKSRMKEFVQAFNESVYIRHLKPLRDSVEYIRKLHEDHGYVFHCITSLSDNEFAHELRIENLHNLFGKTAITKFHILGCGDDKDEALDQYKDSGYYWIEDKYENALVGKERGLKSVLMKHNYNCLHDDMTIVNNWKEFYNICTNGV